MNFIKETKFNYSTSTMAKALLPYIIQNSKTIVPWNVVLFGNEYICFTNKSKIIWDKKSLTLTNYLCNIHCDFEYPSIDTNIFGQLYNSWYNIVEYDRDKENYPLIYDKQIQVSTNELKISNKFLKFEKINDLQIYYIPEKCKKTEFVNIKTNDPFIAKAYTGDKNKFVNETNMILSAYYVSWFKNKKIFQKIIKFQNYNISTNTKFGINLDEVFNMKNNFEIVDKFNK